MLIYRNENRISFFPSKTKRCMPSSSSHCIDRNTPIDKLFTNCIYKMEITIWMWAILACIACIAQMDREIKWKNGRGSRRRTRWRRRHTNASKRITRCTQPYGFNTFHKKKEKPKQCNRQQQKKKKQEKRKKLNFFSLLYFFQLPPLRPLLLLYWCCVCVFI